MIDAFYWISQSAARQSRKKKCRLWHCRRCVCVWMLPAVRLLYVIPSYIQFYCSLRVDCSHFSSASRVCSHFLHFTLRFVWLNPKTRTYNHTNREKKRERETHGHSTPSAMPSVHKWFQSSCCGYFIYIKHSLIDKETKLCPNPPQWQTNSKLYCRCRSMLRLYTICANIYIS